MSDDSGSYIGVAITCVIAWLIFGHWFLLIGVSALSTFIFFAVVIEIVEALNKWRWKRRSDKEAAAVRRKLGKA